MSFIDDVIAATRQVGGATQQAATKTYQAPVLDPIKQQQADLLAKYLASAGGGSGPPDWYYSGNLANDSRGLDITSQNNQFNQDFSKAQFEYQKSQDAIANALRQGDFELAKQKQADANYWQGKQLEAQQRMEAASNASAERRASIAAGAEVQSAQIGAQAQIQAASIRAATDRQASNQQLQANLANAVNDADRNQAYVQWNQEQAAISKMEDDTKRIIASNQSKIDLFNAETNRQGVAGDLAQKQNEFLLNASTNPRDLFGLYFMQRGVAPDWQALANGGTPATGTPLAPQNALTAYTPQSGLPQLDFGAGPSYGTVGQATGAYHPAANPFIAGGVGMYDQGGGGGSSQTTVTTQGGPTTLGWDMGQPAPTPAPAPAPVQPGPIDPTNVPWSGGGNQVVIPGIARDFDGTDIKRYAGGTENNGVDAIGTGGVTRQIGPAPVGWNTLPQQDSFQMTPTWGGGSQNAVRNTGPSYNFDFPTNPNGNPNSPDIGNSAPTQTPGFTTAPQIMTGDAAHPDPFANGAKPELVQNPTGAPLRVLNSAQTMADPGVQAMVNSGNPNTNILPYGNDNVQNGVPLRDQINLPAPRPRPFVGPQTQPYFPRQFIPDPNAVATSVAYNNVQPVNTGSGFYLDPQTQFRMNTYKQMLDMYGQNGIRRYPLGTDVSSQYAGAGLGQLWMPSSGNDYLSNTTLPSMLDMLRNQGVPISPSLANTATGRLSPTLNLSSAFAQRGGGVLPSLQALNRMTTGERQNFQGYSEGVVGVPWQDTIDFLGQPTQNLRTAVASKGAY